MQVHLNRLKVNKIEKIWLTLSPKRAHASLLMHLKPTGFDDEIGKKYYSVFYQRICCSMGNVPYAVS